MIIALSENSECCVRTENGETWFFRIMSSIKKGYVLSPFLFVMIMDYVLQKSSGSTVKISSRQIWDLDFEDDVILLEETKQQLQMLLDTITYKAENVGLSISVDKSKVMTTFNSPLILRCKDKYIQQVQEFKYLGSWIEYDGEIMKEIKKRIGQAT